MHINNVIVALAAVSVSQAWIIPEGLEDGMHTVGFDVDGNEAIQKVDGDWLKGINSSDNIHQRRHPKDMVEHLRRAPLPAGQDGCTGSGLSYSDLSAAQFMLYSYCGTGRDINPSIMTWTQGGVTAYVCNYAGPNPCSASEAQAAFASLSGDCGTPSSPLAGWYWIADWGKTYGYDRVGAGICTNM